MNLAPGPSELEIPMINRMKDRCRLICGSSEADCFVMNRNQLHCIADLVINKTTAISMMLELSLSEKNIDQDGEAVRMAFASTNELTNWIKYLQMVGGMKELHSLVLGSDLNEKRGEIRYPLPESHADRVGVSIDDPEGLAFLRVLNFSQSGVRFISPAPYEVGDLIECCLVSSKGSRDDPVVFKAEVRNCRGSAGGSAGDSNGGYEVGANVLEVSGKDAFNFFVNMHALMLSMDIIDNM